MPRCSNQAPRKVHTDLLLQRPSIGISQNWPSKDDGLTKAPASVVAAVVTLLGGGGGGGSIHCVLTDSSTWCRLHVVVILQKVRIRRSSIRFSNLINEIYIYQPLLAVHERLRSMLLGAMGYASCWSSAELTGRTVEWSLYCKESVGDTDYTISYIIDPM